MLLESARFLKLTRLPFLMSEPQRIKSGTSKLLVMKASATQVFPEKLLVEDHLRALNSYFEIHLALSQCILGRGSL